MASTLLSWTLASCNSLTTAWRFAIRFLWIFLLGTSQKSRFLNGKKKSIIDVSNGCVVLMVKHPAVNGKSGSSTLPIAAMGMWSNQVWWLVPGQEISIRIRSFPFKSFAAVGQSGRLRGLKPRSYGIVRSNRACSVCSSRITWYCAGLLYQYCNGIIGSNPVLSAGL